MATNKVHFAKEKETMLMTLYGRAVQNRWQPPILKDPWAEEAVKHIEYDFSKVDKIAGIFSPLFVNVGPVVVASRAATFDLLVNQYLAEHPDAIVLHLGCGMDSRYFRINPPASVQWFDVDYPEVIDLRRQLYPERKGCHLIGAALEDLRWLDAIPSDHPVLMVAEGVLPYLTENQVKSLLNAITSHFPAGGQMVFDAMPTFIIKSKTSSNVGGTGAVFRWGINDPHDIRKLEPHLEFIQEIPNSGRIGFSRFPGWVRAIYRVQEFVPALRRLDRIVVYRF